MIRKVVGYLLLFLLLYFDYLYIGPIKLSHLWKVILFVYLLYVVFKHKLPNRVTRFLIIGFVTSLSIFYNTNLKLGVSGDITFFLDIISIPLFVSYFFICIIYKKYLEVESFVLSISIFVILSNIPFLTGWLSPKEAVSVGYDTKDFGVKVFGIFNNASGASKIFAVSSIIILAYFKRFWSGGVVRKLFWIVLTIVGFLSVIYSFARTGWFIYVLGILIMFLYRSSIKTKFLAILVSLVLVPTVISVFSQNVELYNRLIGKKENKVYVEGDYNRISSGRADLFLHSIDIFNEMSPMEKLIGIGTYGALEEMKLKTRTKTFSHNRLLELLLVGGIFTLFLYVFYLKNIIRLTITKITNKDNFTKRLPITLLILFLMSLIPSHGFGFYCNVLFSGILVLGQKYKYEVSS